ncbi:HAD-IA family hydrolase [Rhizobium grahamii]|uniref:HAD family hydrolase n=1 Tax=Rhizobium grahamii TaxID=1120045 RepID=A0A370KE32_9HYPH|nr:HAD-IA family hydrolase [Rhizobium grahamii]RDJ01870.1 HAD family hydrolase [Rhizobium grahamii]
MPRTFVQLNCQAVLCDMDGVLVDSISQIERCLRHWASKLNLDVEHIVELSHGRCDRDVVQLAAPCLDVEKEIRLIQAHEVAEAVDTCAKKGAVEFVNSLAPNSWAIVTSGCRAVAEIRLKAEGISIPHTVITSDDVTFGKTDPEGYLSAARHIEVNPANCVVFEDAPAGVAAARAAGMRVIGVLGTVPDDNLRCDFLLSRLDDVTAIRTASTIELHFPVLVHR